MRRSIRFGFSPCPNDTFAFHALVRGLVQVPGWNFSPHLADVEELNRLALGGELEMTKLSFHALGHVLDEYALLRSGAALGRGCGPLVVARAGGEPRDLSSARLAVPGKLTTANLLLAMYLGKPPEAEAMVFGQVMQAVKEGQVDAGLVIHEGRFTFERLGLVQLLDLGQWWEAETGRPLPLGCIAVRRGLGPETAQALQSGLKASVEYAWAHPLASREFVLAHAQETEAEVIQRHIGLYVNSFTADMGEEGRAAVEEMLARGRALGLLPPGPGLD